MKILFVFRHSKANVSPRPTIMRDILGLGNHAVRFEALSFR